MENEKCPKETEFAERLTSVESRSKSNTRRLDEVEKRQDEQTEIIQSVKLLASEMKHTTDDVKEIKVDVKELKEKPGKRCDSIVDKLLWLLIGAAVAALAAKAGVAL